MRSLDDRRRRRCALGFQKEAVVSRANGELRSHFIRRRGRGGRPTPAAVLSHILSRRVRHGRLPPVARPASPSSPSFPRGPCMSSRLTSCLPSVLFGGAGTRRDEVADGPGSPSDAVTLGGGRWRPDGSVVGGGRGLDESWAWCASLSAETAVRTSRGGDDVQHG